MMLELKKISKDFNSTVVLDTIDLSIGKSEVVALQGHSGCGKSTLLRIVALLESFDAGVLSYRKRSLSSEESYIRQKRQRVARYPTISFLMQDLFLWPHLTCEENLDLVRTHRDTETYCTALGIHNLLGRYPHQISRGQAQRFAFVRAISSQPELLLLDEPSSSLDRGNTAILAQIINQLSGEGVGILVVTHDTHLISSLNITQHIEMENGKIIKYQ